MAVPFPSERKILPKRLPSYCFSVHKQPLNSSDYFLIYLLQGVFGYLIPSGFVTRGLKVGKESKSE